MNAKHSQVASSYWWKPRCYLIYLDTAFFHLRSIQLKDILAKKDLTKFIGTLQDAFPSEKNTHYTYKCCAGILILSKVNFTVGEFGLTWTNDAHNAKLISIAALFDAMVLILDELWLFRIPPQFVNFSNLSPEVTRSICSQANLQFPASSETVFTELAFWNYFGSSAGVWRTYPGRVSEKILYSFGLQNYFSIRAKAQCIVLIAASQLENMYQNCTGICA